MKFSKSLIIISLMLVFCISLGAVSAADSADMSVNDINDDATIESSINVNNEITEVNEGETGSFADLNKTISESDNDTIYLEQDYKFVEDTDSDFENGIEITKDDITIDGQGFTIDGSNLARAFYITANNVTLKNITFINCSAIGGGAIYLNNGGSVVGCSFVNCVATDYGDGGAIYLNNGGSVVGCSFVNCVATDYGDGGAICTFDDCRVVNCSFVDCEASNGGAICTFGDCRVVNCSFVGCNADDDGSAISFSDCYGGSVENCSFVNCSAGHGAIYFYGNDNVSVVGCSFVNCSAIGDIFSSGGAIYFNGPDATVIGCTFTDCSATGDGGAIYFNGPDYATVIGCTFTDCSAIGGGAIYLTNGNAAINYCIFENNDANTGKDIIVGFKCSLEYNFFGFQNNVTDFPELIYASYDGKTYFAPDNWVVLDIVKSGDDYVVKFITNEAFELPDSMPEYNASLTINNETKNIAIKNNTFKDTYVKGNYSLTSLNGVVLAETNLEYSEDSFTALYYLMDNKESVVLNHDYKFYADSDYKFINGLPIANNIVIDGNGYTIDASNLARIFNINGGNVTIKNLKFVNGIANYYGGAIYSENSDLNIYNCSFMNCSATDADGSHGGAIYSDSVNVFDSDFVGCSAEWGAAICSEECSVSGCSFVNYIINWRGGAIYAYSVNVFDSDFVGCSAVYGGAIYAYSVSASGCSFVDCSATGDSEGSYGGAIYSSGVSASGCSFVNCSATGGSEGSYGGAIYSYENVVTLVKCSFVNCSSDFGGVISSYNDYLTVDGCSFVNCSAGTGGAINSEEDSIAIDGCSFVNCSAESGGAICSIGGLITVDGCSFVNCSATDEDGSHGGAICSIEGLITVDGCSFVNCSADFGGAIASSDRSKIFNYNIFDNNKADYGNAMYILNVAALKLNYNFFAFQNNVTSFPEDLILEFDEESGEYSNITPDNWVVLNISADGEYYSVGFVLNDGSPLNGVMPDYDVNLSINDDSKNIVVSRNTYKEGLKCGNYSAKSLNSDVVLATFSLDSKPVPDYSIIAWDCDYGDVANIAVVLPKYISGNVTVYVDNQVFERELKEGVAVVLVNGLNAGVHTINVSYSGGDGYLPFNATKTFTVNKVHVTLTPTALSTTYDSGKYFTVKVVNANGKAVSGLKLSLKVYTGSSFKTVTVSTDANGIAKYSASKLSIGTHNVVISVPNSNYVVDVPKNSSIKVSKAPTTVTAKKVTVKKGAKKYFSVTIKNKATKKVVKSIYLKIKVYTGKKYKTYKVKTNSKGVAKLSTKALKKGTHKVVISTTSKYYTVKKSGKLIVVK